MFCRLDAGSCSFYQANLTVFQRKLDEKMSGWTAKLAPFKGTSIVTYHSTWRYFAARFGLVSDTYLEPKPGIPPSPPHLAEVMKAMTAEKIGVVLVEPFQSRKTAEAVAARTGAVVVDVCQFPGGLPGTANDYLAMIDANVKAVVAGLRTGK